MTTRLAQGFDKTLRTETAFSAGFMMDPLDDSGQKSAISSDLASPRSAIRAPEEASGLRILKTASGSPMS